MKYTPTEKEALSVKQSRNGKGIFAKKDFKKNTTLFEVTGPLITCDVDDDLDDETRANTYRYDTDRYINPHNTIGRYLNHSCEPNAKVIKKNKKLFVVSITPITKGQELFIDYSTIQADDDIWDMSCNCGTSACRKIIKNFGSLPKKLREKYISQKIVPKHILL